MKPAVYKARVVGAGRDKTKIKRPSQAANLGELLIPGQLVEVWPEFLHVFGHTPVACVARSSSGVSTDTQAAGGKPFGRSALWRPTKTG